MEIKSINRLGRTEADRDKQGPRRWFLFHVSETKPALLIEHSKDLKESISRSGHFSVFGNQNPVISLDRKIAMNGQKVWCDPSLDEVCFFDDTVKRAIMAKGLRTPAFKFKPCLLV